MKKPGTILYLLTLTILTVRGTVSFAGNDTTSTPLRSRYSIGLQIGSTGVGGQVAWQLPIRPRVVLRAGLSNLAVGRTIQLRTDGDGKILIQPSVVQNFALGSIKWHPFRSSSFFVTAGGGYARRSALNLTIQAESKITFGGLEMTPENVGTINARFDWGRALGYAGLGFGRSVPAHRVGFGMELGCYYLGIPTIGLQYDGFLETTTIQEQIPVIQRNLAGYRYLPALQFTLTYILFR